MFEFLVPGLAMAIIGSAAVFLFTRRGSRARAWITATPNRIAMLGMLILVLVWAGVAIYNGITRSDDLPHPAPRLAPASTASY